MAAGQRKKKLNGASVVRLNFYEQNVGRKKTKLESSDIILNMTSHVSLEWDENQNKVVAKREQIGLTWRDMAPFLDHVPELRTALADVFSVPQEIFGLENIADVLSYEVWTTSLSEQERRLLIQLLPKGVDVNNLVQSLLGGENFHFGNPFCKWGASLCAGDLHPDAVLHMERQLTATRHSYFCELRNYQSRVIDNLSKLKERWTSCKNPENETARKIQREGIIKSIMRSPSGALEKTKVLSSSEKEQPHDTCFRSGDTAKYMSYIKINKKQHQLVKSINYFGDGVHSKCLNHVLGDIKGFDIQPYEAFEEEERKRLHKHWLHLANKDIPAAFENYTECRLLRYKWRKCVQNELLEKVVMTKDERENLGCSPVKQLDDRDSEQGSSVDMEDEGYVLSNHFNNHHHMERSPSLDSHQELSPSFSDQEQNVDIFEATTTHSIYHSMDNCPVEKIPSLNSPPEHTPSAIDQGGNGYIVERETTSPGPSKFDGREDDTTESKAPSMDAHHLGRLPSLNRQKQFSTTHVHEDGNQHSIKCSQNAPVISQFLQCMTRDADAVEEKLSVSSPKDIWQCGSTGNCYHHYSPESPVCTASGVLALQLPQPMKERSPQIIGLEAQLLDREAAESIASALHDNSKADIFSSNTNQDHNLLLSSFHMQGISTSYSQQQHLNGPKQSGLQFVVTNDGIRQSSQFSHLFHEQQQLLKQNQARERELYMQPIMNRNTHSSSRYPSQGRFLSVGLQDLANFQSPVNSALMGHNWFTGEHDTRNGWSGAETFRTVGQRVEDAGSADGSLFSVLSECNKLPSHSPFVSTSSEGYPRGGNFVSTSNLHSDSIYTYAPVNDTSSRDAAVLKMNSMPWMNFSLQNRGL